MIVPNYGVHWAEGGISFLMQPQNTQNLISPQLACPFTVVQNKPRVRCPHEIDLEEYGPNPDWMSDPLAQVMAPTPKGNDEPVYVLHDPDHSKLHVALVLAQLCSPTENIVRPIWWYNPSGIARNYRVTNITPMVWMNCRLEHSKELTQHIDLAQANGRRLLLIAENPLPLFGPHIRQISTDLTTSIAEERLRAIGAGVLRRHMETHSAVSA